MERRYVERKAAGRNRAAEAAASARRYAERRRRRFEGASDAALEWKADKLLRKRGRLEDATFATALMTFPAMLLCLVAIGFDSAAYAGEAGLLQRFECGLGALVVVGGAGALAAAGLFAASRLLGSREWDIRFEIERRRREAPAEGGGDEG